MNARIVCAFAVGVLAALLATRDARAQNCARFGSCGPCAADPSCGWCAANGTCMAGDANGAPGCAGGWAWVPSQCSGAPANSSAQHCAQFHDCTSCAADIACGWCGANGACMAGTSTGAPGCGGGWAWVPSACGAAPMQSDPCVRYTSCLPCAQDNACGWCGATQQCMSGAGVPGTSTPGCQGGWAPMPEQCGGLPPPPPPPPPPPLPPPPPPPPPSSQATFCAMGDCDSCTRTNGCGWCTVGGCMQNSADCRGAWIFSAWNCPGGPATSMTPPPVSVDGPWNSAFGVVTLRHGALAQGQSVDVSGSWAQPAGVGSCASSTSCVGQISGGRYYPSAGVINFNYYQPWNGVSGTMTCSFPAGAPPPRLTCRYTQPGSTGDWSLWR